jgi:hypothetical protein
MAAVGFSPVSATALNERRSILIWFLVIRLISWAAAAPAVPGRRLVRKDNFDFGALSPRRRMKQHRASMHF